MNPRRFSLIAGSIMILLALLSFIPGLNQSPEGLPPLQLETNYGVFLGFLPLNILTQLALLVFGAGGLVAYFSKNKSLPNSIRHARWVAYVMGLAAVLGMIPATQTLFGYWPLFGNEVIVHGTFAVLGAYFGFRLPLKAHEINEARGLNAKVI